MNQKIALSPFRFFLNNVLLASAMFFSVLQLPDLIVRNTHDEGSEAALGYWLLHGFQFGRDIVQNVGPLGFLSFPEIFTGFFDLTKLCVNIFLTGSFVFLFLKSTRELPAFFRPFFYAFAFFFVDRHIMPYLLFLFIAYWIMTKPTIWFALFATLIMAILGLGKGTGFFLSILILSTVLINSVFLGRFFFAFCSASSFIFFFVTLWMLAGQELHSLPTFIHALFKFSEGYNEAMIFFEPSKFMVSGLIMLLGCLVPIFWRAMCALRLMKPDAQKQMRFLLLTCVDFFILFIVWKHGFVRADRYHVPIFSKYILIASIWIFFREKVNFGWKQLLSWSRSQALIILYVLVLAAALVGGHCASLKKIKKRSVDLIKTVSNVVSMPQYLSKQSQSLRHHIAKMQIPNTRAEAQDQTISYFGFLPAVMLYNGFNYISTPSTISFAAWNSWIMNKDATYFREEQGAPEYLLFDLATIDNRLVAQDSSLAQLEILHRYTSASAENGNLLLRRATVKPSFSMQSVSTRREHLGEWINVPSGSLLPLWVEITLHKSFLSKAISFFYKPPQYSIELQFQNGKIEIYQFIPGMAATGFLLNPLITGNRNALAVRFNSEYQQYLNNANPSLSRVVRFRIRCDHLSSVSSRYASVNFKEVHGLTLGFDSDIDKFYMLNAQQFGFDLQLIDYASREMITSPSAYDHHFYQFSAPAFLTIKKSPGRKKLTAWYAGSTDDIELSISLKTEDGKSLLLKKMAILPEEFAKESEGRFLAWDTPEEEGTLILAIQPLGPLRDHKVLIRKVSLQDV